MTNTSLKTSSISAPRWMTKAEKMEFGKVLSIRKAASNPVQEAEMAMICDLVSARSRISAMRNLFRRAVIECKDSDFISTQKHLLAISSAIDRATASATKMAVKLAL